MTNLKASILTLFWLLITVGCTHSTRDIAHPVISNADGTASAASKDFLRACIDVAKVFNEDIHILKSEFKSAGEVVLASNSRKQSVPSLSLPEHCEIIGALQERIGVAQESYSIKFHLRLPANWNDRLYMEGGGGTNGDLSDAIGFQTENITAISKGYAVLSQDSGHDNSINSEAEKGGITAFGGDPIARANYGGKSLPLVVMVSKKIINYFYNKAPVYSYFVGCSKGGQEGMMLAQRYPELFDGIIASAPGMSLPRAAIAEAWDTQSFAQAAKKPLTLNSLAQSFSDGDLQLVRNAVLSSCDQLDGLKDGMINNFPACKSETVLTALREKLCVDQKNALCLTKDQIPAIERVQRGPTDEKGESVYASFPWDAGWADASWRMWKIGSADGKSPPINVSMGAPALANIFTVPPKRLAFDLEKSFDFALSFDVQRHTQDIYAQGGNFATSAWQDIAARSNDLDEFKRRGGKLIVPHGVSDPVFSINDTINWWHEVDARYKGGAASIVRVFPVPGMTHCGGGPAANNFNAFSYLVEWVEHKNAPDWILGTAGDGTPWPGRTRPLCAYPSTAYYNGGDNESAESFSCRDLSH